MKNIWKKHNIKRKTSFDPYILQKIIQIPKNALLNILII